MSRRLGADRDAPPAPRHLTAVQAKALDQLRESAEYADQRKAAIVKLREELAAAIELAATAKVHRNDMIARARDTGLNYREMRAVTGLTTVSLARIVNDL